MRVRSSGKQSLEQFKSMSDDTFERVRLESAQPGVAVAFLPYRLRYRSLADRLRPLCRRVRNQFLTGFCYYRGTFNGKWFAQGGPAHNYRRKLTSDELKIADDRDRGNSLFVDVMDA